MAEPKTRPTSVPAATLIDAVPDPQRRADCIALTGLMHAATGTEPVVWGRDLVGFGTWTMRYANGKSADWPLIAFSPRKADLTLYLMEGFDGHRERLRRLGRCRIGKSCLYIRRLADVDVDVLRELLAASVDAMRARHGMMPTPTAARPVAASADGDGPTVSADAAGSIAIRRLRRGEGALLRALRLAALADAPTAFATSYASALARTLASWDEQADATVEGCERCTFVAFAGDVAAGLTALYRTAGDRTHGELLQVWVAPAWRGRGAALGLLDAALRWAGDCGLRRVVATVTRDNARAARFYLKHGFAPDPAAATGPNGEAVLVRAVDDAGTAPPTAPWPGAP